MKNQQLKLMLSQILSILLIVTALSSCATQNIAHKSKIERDPSTFKPDTGYEYRIKSDDKINMSIWDHDNMSVGSVYGIYNSNEVYGKWLMVDQVGFINIPKYGLFQIEGMTITEAQTALRKIYRQWIVEPVIEIKVLNREVNVIGELKTPGKYLLERNDNSLLDVVSKAGYFDFYANKKKIQVMRTVDGIPKKINIDLTKAGKTFEQNIQIYPNDIVYVPARRAKVWDKRAGSIIIPLVSVISTAILLSKVK
jgi:polysaccharide biosynthesis/export protein